MMTRIPPTTLAPGPSTARSDSDRTGARPALAGGVLGALIGAVVLATTPGCHGEGLMAPRGEAAGVAVPGGEAAAVSVWADGVMVADLERPELVAALLAVLPAAVRRELIATGAAATADRAVIAAVRAVVDAGSEVGSGRTSHSGFIYRKTWGQIKVAYHG